MVVRGVCMRKVLFILPAICLILLIMFWQTAEKDYPSSLYDLSNNSVSQLNISDDIVRVDWASDSKHFLLTESPINGVGLWHNKLYEVVNLNEIILPEEVNECNAMQSRWIDNNNLCFTKDLYNVLIYNLDYKKAEHKYELPDTIRKIFEAEKKEFNTPRTFSEAVRNEIELLNTKYMYSSVYVSKDESKFIFHNKQNEIYIYDRASKKDKFLTKGVEYWLYANDTMLVYYIPKRTRVEKYKDDGVNNTDEFDTYIYDIEKSTSIKLAEFYAKCCISPDKRYIVFYPTSEDNRVK